MTIRIFPIIVMVAVASSILLAQAPDVAKPEGELIGIIQGFLDKTFNNGWDSVEKLPRIRWTSPAAELKDCLPDGNCYARQGAANLGGRNITAVAAGARTFAVSLYLRNPSSPFGEEAVLAALRTASFTAELARCPASGQPGGTNWYRLRSPKSNPGVLSIQTSCNGRACEGFVVSQGENLPPLQANQVRLYSEVCTAGADRKPVSTLLPHEVLARTLASLIPLASVPALYDWKAFLAMKTQVEWAPHGVTKSALTFLNDPNPFSTSGSVAYAGRRYNPMASGSETQVRVVYFAEGGLHSQPEDLLGVLRAQGFAVQLARCGPVYTESTNNWYRVTSEKTRPVMLQQSLRRDGSQFQGSYALRLDGTLPARDPRDRDPGAAGCQ